MLSSLLRANQGILRHKIILMDALVTKYGFENANATFQQICPIAKSSIGQHMRHSMDHVERAVTAALNSNQTLIQYDIRDRGTLDESDMTKARERVQSVLDSLDRLQSHEIDDKENDETVLNRPVQASFMLSGDETKEYPIPSTVGRELAFSAHHAIHHLAMVRIIATTSAGLLPKDIPEDFGRAPSTVNFDRAKPNT